MEFKQTSIDGVMVLEPRVFSDPRGFFMETHQRQQFAEAGISVEFVQDNHSGSVKGTLRGLHYQLRQTQGKLVQVVVGEIYDVVVDLRLGSPTFSQFVS